MLPAVPEILEGTIISGGGGEVAGAGAGGAGGGASTAAGAAGGGLLGRFGNFLHGSQSGDPKSGQQEPALDNQSMISDVTSRMQSVQSDL